MNARQETKRSMFLVVEELINNTDPTVLATMPNFTPYFDEFKDGLTELRDASEEQIYSRLGYQMEKSEQRMLMSELCLNVSSRVKAYASNEGDSILFEKMNRKMYALKRLNDTLILDYCQQVHDKAEELLPSLASYGLIAADLVLLQDAIAAYLELIPKPRYEIVNRKQATRNIATHIAFCEEKLAKIDILVEMLEFSNPSFFVNYFDNRKLVNTGSRKISLRGTVTNEQGLKIEGAKVRISALNLEKTTTAKGYFEMKHVPPGVYTATFEKEGMVTESRAVAVSANLRTTVDVRLENSLPMQMAS
jgi:hypothetical protein